MTYQVGQDHITYPYSAVTYIEVTFPDGARFTGSGAVVGVNDVLTASHVIYDNKHGGLAEEITVYPGRDGGETPFGSYEWDHVDYFEVDQDGDGEFTRSESQYDLAILGFNEKLGNNTGYFAIDYLASDGRFNLTGYPGVYRDLSGPRMTNDFGTAYTSNSPFVWDYGNIESNSGISGGPLWYSDNGTPYVTGVASTGGWAVDVYAQREKISQWIDGNDYLLTQNNLPITRDDSSGTLQGLEVLIDALANDNDPDGDTLSISAVTDPNHGETQIVGGEISYSPRSGFTGTDSFTYSVSDGNGGTDTASVTIDVETMQLDEVFRFYNTDAGGHFYTTSVAEAQHVRNTSRSLNDEGVGFTALAAESSEFHPAETDVFRFYNTDAGGHFYTASETEADHVRNTLENLLYEGVGFRAFEEQVEGTIPVFRFYNTDAGGHFYTPNAAEAENVRNNVPSFNDEGVGFYAYPHEFDVEALGLSNTDVDGIV